MHLTWQIASLLVLSASSLAAPSSSIEERSISKRADAPRELAMYLQTHRKPGDFGPDVFNLDVSEMLNTGATHAIVGAFHLGSGDAVKLNDYKPLDKQFDLVCWLNNMLII